MKTSVMDKTPEEWSQHMRAQRGGSARNNALFVIVLLLFAGLACGVGSLAVAVDAGISTLSVAGGVISLLLLGVSIAWMKKLR